MRSVWPWWGWAQPKPSAAWAGGAPAHRPAPRGHGRNDRRSVRRGPGVPGPRSPGGPRTGAKRSPLTLTSAGFSTTRPWTRWSSHAQPLARAGDGLGLPGGQGCLCREAVFVRPLGRAADGGGGPQVRPHGPGRHPEPFEPLLRQVFDCLRGGELGAIRFAHALVYRAARRHRQGQRADAAAGHRGLRPLVRPGAQEAADAQAIALRVALVLGHRQRRDGQQWRPRHRRVPLGPGTEPAAAASA